MGIEDEMQGVLAAANQAANLHQQRALRRLGIADPTSPEEAERNARDNERHRLGMLEAAMARVLQDGPRALAAHEHAKLVDFVRDDRLKASSRDYDPSEHGGRLVLGPTGIGKSMAAVAVLRRLLGINPLGRLGALKAHWARALDLANARLAWKLGDGTAPAIAQAQSAEFLVLDDIGWESKRASGDEVVPEVIAHRYDRGLVTFATSGLTESAFAERYGSAVMRRLIETGGLPGRVLNLWPKKGSSDV